MGNERELTGQLGVGRSTVREALNGLAMLGIGEIRLGQGAFVSEESDVADSFNVLLAEAAHNEVLSAMIQSAAPRRHRYGGRLPFWEVKMPPRQRKSPGSADSSQRVDGLVGHMAGNSVADHRFADPVRLFADPDPGPDETSFHQPNVDEQYYNTGYFGEGQDYFDQYYFDQFYEPFRCYDRPVFAIAGNHDGAMFATLHAFLRNFCANSAAPPTADGFVLDLQTGQVATR